MRRQPYAVACDRCHGNMFDESGILCAKCHGDGRILICETDAHKRIEEAGRVMEEFVRAAKGWLAALGRVGR